MILYEQIFAFALFMSLTWMTWVWNDTLFEYIIRNKEKGNIFKKEKVRKK